jgi:DNA-directed RNA polymerase alpha subunit
VVLEWTKADEEEFARFMLRRRWLNVVQPEGVVTVAQLRALSEDRLREIPNLGPLSIADISAAVSDRALRPDDPIEVLALPAARPIRERDEALIRMR